jgi:hypothetical protein
MRADAAFRRLLQQYRPVTSLTATQQYTCFYATPRCQPGHVPACESRPTTKSHSESGIPETPTAPDARVRCNHIPFLALQDESLYNRVIQVHGEEA